LGGGEGRRLRSNFEGRITLRERRYAIFVTTASQVISSALICRAHGCVRTQSGRHVSQRLYHSRVMQSLAHAVRLEYHPTSEALRACHLNRRRMTCDRTCSGFAANLPPSCRCLPCASPTKQTRTFWRERSRCMQGTAGFEARQGAAEIADRVATHHTA
jgi:hypothetical protein